MNSDSDAIFSFLCRLWCSYLQTVAHISQDFTVHVHITFPEDRQIPTTPYIFAVGCLAILQPLLAAIPSCYYISSSVAG